MGAVEDGRRLACRANRRRGEVEGMIDGERRILCLTLGALAELETALDVDSLGMLAARLSAGRLRAGDLIAILGAGLRGAGNAVADEDVAMLSVDGGVEGAARLVGELLRVTFGAAGEASDAGAVDGVRGASAAGGGGGRVGRPDTGMGRTGGLVGLANTGATRAGAGGGLAEGGTHLAGGAGLAFGAGVEEGGVEEGDGAPGPLQPQG